MLKIGCIGDIHGDVDQAKKILQKHGVIDYNGSWAWGDGTLVFIGDLTDRGPKGIETIQMVMRLENEARNVDGQVVSLMGNHDAMILSRAFEHLGQSSDYDCAYLFKANGGKEEEAIALALNDDLLQWMIKRPLMFRFRDLLFQHVDGMDFYPALGNTIEEINSKGLELAKNGKGAWSLFYDLTDEREWGQNGFRRLPAYLEKMKAKVVIHGHTRHKGDGPKIYLDGLAINVDNTLSIGYGSDNPNRGCFIDLTDY